MDSAIAIPTFGSGKTLLATDETDGVHTLKVTTEAGDNGFAVWGFNLNKYVLHTVAQTVDGQVLHTLCVTTDAPEASIAFNGYSGSVIVLGVVQSGTLNNGEPIYTLCVTTDEPNSAVAVWSYNSSATVIATVESGGVHVPVVSDAESGDAPQAFWSWGNQNTVLAADTSGSGPAVIPLVLGLGPAYDPDAAAYFAWGGITDPAVKAAANQFVLDLKAASIWSGYDVIIPHANQDSTAACFNMVKNDHHATQINSPTFTQYEGFTGNGSNMALDIDYNFSTDMVALSANNFGISSYVRNNRTSGNPNYCALGALGGSPDFLNVCVLPWQGATVLGAARNQAALCSTAYITVATPATSRGIHQASRTGSTAAEYDITGISKGTTSGTVGPVPNSTVGVLCRKLFNGSREFYSPDQVSFSTIRRGFTTAEALAEANAMIAYMTALGTNTI